MGLLWDLPFENQTWQWKIDYLYIGAFPVKTSHFEGIFHCHVWLPEGTPFSVRERTCWDVILGLVLTSHVDPELAKWSQLGPFFRGNGPGVAWSQTCPLSQSHLWLPEKTHQWNDQLSSAETWLIPSGKLTYTVTYIKYGKSPFLLGNSSITGPCSIAMSNYQRVYISYEQCSKSLSHSILLVGL